MKNLDQNISEINIKWIEILKSLHNEIKPINIFFSLIKNTYLVKIQSNVVYIFTENKTLEQTINKYSKKILEKIREKIDSNINEIITINKKIIKEEIQTIQKKENDNFIWSYFENENSIKKIENFIDQEKKRILLIKGPENSGKSFLMEKIINYLRNNHKEVSSYNLSTIYYLLEINTNLKNNYFIIDNIDEISSKKQKEIFNAIKKNKNFFIVSEKKNSILDEEIKKADYKYTEIFLNQINEKVINYILKSKIKFTVYPDSYQVLIKYLKNSPKDIDKLLTSLNLFYKQNIGKIVNKEDIDNIVEMLGIKLSTIDVDKIFNVISYKLGISIDDIKSSSRKRKYVIARSLIAYILRKKYDYTLNDIGKELNKNSHSTVINLINLYQKKLINNLELKKILNLFNLKEKII